MLQHGLPIDAVPARAGAWYRQPVLWLGAGILIASLAGCVWMIVLGARHADVPVEGAHPHTLLDMPVHGSGHARPPPGAAPGTVDAPAGRRP
jgi:hypothetical protein